MSKLQQMLGMNGGSFKRAEAMAHDLIGKGHPEIWLDLALLYHAQSKIVKARQALAQYAKLEPESPRLKFGQTWFKLYDGDLQGGLEHIEFGRALGCLGAGREFHRLNAVPRWDGRADLHGKRVLLYCEGGQGDQMMGLRSKVWLEQRGANVIVACSPCLCGLFAVAGSGMVVEWDAASSVQADYWLPSMSSFRLCGCTWETIWPDSYLSSRPRDNAIWSRIIPKQTGILNVGLRWRGNPEFEREQFRWFDPAAMFALAELPGVKCWSLQKDDHAAIMPAIVDDLKPFLGDWCQAASAVLPDTIADLEPLLGDWCQTAAAINRLDLVITSCTGIAHLSAAMGKPTWVVVPAMCYWPWARPGGHSQWYPAVRLFRQEKFGNWDKPFAECRKALKKLAARHSAKPSIIPSTI